jgi:hypothetical protein
MQKGADIALFEDGIARVADAKVIADRAMRLIGTTIGILLNALAGAGKSERGESTA